MVGPCFVSALPREMASAGHLLTYKSEEARDKMLSCLIKTSENKYKICLHRERKHDTRGSGSIFKSRSAPYPRSHQPNFKIPTQEDLCISVMIEIENELNPPTWKEIKNLFQPMVGRWPRQVISSHANRWKQETTCFHVSLKHQKIHTKSVYIEKVLTFPRCWPWDAQPQIGILRAALHAIMHLCRQTKF